MLERSLPGRSVLQMATKSSLTKLPLDRSLCVQNQSHLGPWFGKGYRLVNFSFIYMSRSWESMVWAFSLQPILRRSVTLRASHETHLSQVPATLPHP